MKNKIFEFVRRGFVACGFGPLVLAVVYLILQHNGVVQTLTVNEVCMGIISLSLLAFIVGGMNIIYQIERLPLMMAILIHGGVLYLCYLGTYLLNGWLKRDITTILVFSVIFVACFAAIWVVIYSITKTNTQKLNAMLKKKQNESET